MKTKSFKYFTIITVATFFLVIALGFITADKKPDDNSAVFIKKLVYKENV